MAAEQPTPTDDEIDDRIDLWHRGAYPDDTPLHAALGWSEEEFGSWLVEASRVPARPLPPPPGA